jgi:hypothetical protein
VGAIVGFITELFEVTVTRTKTKQQQSIKVVSKVIAAAIIIVF